MNTTDSNKYQQLASVGVTLTLIAIATAVGNTLVILSVALIKKLQTPSNFLIVSLACSDFLVSLLVMPYAIYHVLNNGKWHIGEVLCDLFTYFDVLLCTSSILNLCAISIDRYLAITKPLQYASKRTPKRMFLMIFFVWVISALVSIPPIFGFKKTFKDGECMVSQNIFYQMFATIFAFYLPLIVMIVLYIRILKLARKMARADYKLNMLTRSHSEGLELPVPNSLNHQDYPTVLSDFHPSNLAQSGEVKQQRSIPSTTERYPLPPSTLCRRKHPRPLHRLTSYTSLSNPENVDKIAFDTDVSLPFVDQSVDTLPTTRVIALRSQSSLLRSISANHDENRWSSDDKDYLSTNFTNNTSGHMYRPKPGAYKQRPPWQNKKSFISNSNFNSYDNSRQLLPVESDSPLEFFVGRRKSSLLMSKIANSRKNEYSLDFSPQHQELKRSSLLDLQNRGRNPSWISLKFPLKRKRSRLHGETKAIKTLGIIMGCFCLCWIPFFIIAISKPIYKNITGEQKLEIPDTVEVVFLWLGYLNSTLNPVIYALFNMEFRVPFKELLMCRCVGINARLRSERFAIEYGGFTQPSATTLGGLAANSTWGSGFGHNMSGVNVSTSQVHAASSGVLMSFNQNAEEIPHLNNNHARH